MEEKSNYLEFRDILKQFPGVVALKEVSFNVKKGEIHAIVGENGAGKSTIMKVLAGIYIPDGGQIFLDGSPIIFHNPREALLNGISMIHQELELVLEMTVEQNLFLGREEGSKIGFLNKKKMILKAKELLALVGLDIDPGVRMSSLSVATMQLIEIVKAISYDAKIIIMDEPTSAIGEVEKNYLFRIIKSLKEQGKTIIYISHKLDEIFQIAETCTILRDGNVVITKPIGELTKEAMISYMVGRKLKEFYTKKEAQKGNILFEIKSLNVAKRLNNVSLNVRSGEILGIAGLVGAGKTELAETIFGLRRVESGEIFVKGVKKNINNPVDAFNNGIGFITEDRKIYGLNLKGNTKQNISIVNLNKYTVLKQFINIKKENKVVNSVIDLFQIKVPGGWSMVESLSGGNQQKVVISKWFLLGPDVLIMDEPTRGIDIGAKAEIYKIVSDLAVSGKAIILISSEMEELISMSDRMIILCSGSITGEFDRGDFNQEEIMACAAGHKKRRND